MYYRGEERTSDLSTGDAKQYRYCINAFGIVKYRLGTVTEIVTKKFPPQKKNLKWKLPENGTNVEET